MTLNCFKKPFIKGKNNFSLLELVVSITIISFIFSFVGIKIHQKVQLHKFKSNYETISYYFDFCKRMALSNQTDIYMKLSQKNKKVFVEIGMDDNMGFFKNVKKINETFENINFLFNLKKEDVEIIFSSTKQVFPTGNFEFYLDNYENTKKVYEIKKSYL